MIKTKMGIIRVFFMRLNWAVRMIFTLRRNCENCGTSHYRPISKETVCMLGGFRIAKIDKGCGDWKPKPW